MNQHDKDNLRFLMTISEESFDQWLAQASQDDIDYALEIIQQARSEYTVEMMDLQDLASTFDDDMTDAKEVINRIKNLGKNA